MSATREAIMNALLAQLVNSPYTGPGTGGVFQTISRRFLTWEAMTLSVQAGATGTDFQPALFIYDGVGLGGGMEIWERPAIPTPPKVFLRKTLVIYARLPSGGTPGGPDSLTPGGAVFHPLIEAVSQALAPDDLSRNVFTLGGLVAHCWIKGNILIMTGEIDPSQGQGMATIPIEILTNLSL
jgi:hypothetical protein